MLFGYRCDIMNGKGMTLGMITAAERRHTGIDYIVSPVFEALGIPHMFTTRYGGVSEGCFESLNFKIRRRRNTAVMRSLRHNAVSCSRS